MGGQRKAWNLQGQKDTGPTYLRVPRSGRGKLLNKDGTVSYPRTNEYVPSQEIYLFHRAPFYLLSTMERGGARPVCPTLTTFNSLGVRHWWGPPSRITTSSLSFKHPCFKCLAQLPGWVKTKPIIIFMLKLYLDVVKRACWLAHDPLNEP